MPGAFMRRSCRHSSAYPRKHFQNHCARPLRISGRLITSRNAEGLHSKCAVPLRRAVQYAVPRGARTRSRVHHSRARPPPALQSLHAPAAHDLRVKAVLPAVRRIVPLLVARFASVWLCSNRSDFARETFLQVLRYWRVVLRLLSPKSLNHIE
jgi:hypothetical protein